MTVRSMVAKLLGRDSTPDASAQPLVATSARCFCPFCKRVRERMIDLAVRRVVPAHFLNDPFWVTDITLFRGYYKRDIPAIRAEFASLNG